MPAGEYVLGVADVTGELMRMAIVCVGKGALDQPFRIVSFLRSLHDALVSCPHPTRDLNHKLRVLKQSLYKVENACYNLQVRASEIPKDMLVEMLAASKDDLDLDAAFNDDPYM